LTGTGTLTVVAGPTVWTGGTMDGAGNTITEGTLDIGLPGDINYAETLDGRTLTNAGTATWAGGGGFSQVDGATFVNQMNATFTIDNGVTWSSDGTGTFANAGTLTELADGGSTTLQAAIDNTGSVQVQQGTLSLQGGGIVGGSYLVLAGAALTFGNDNVTTTSAAVPSDFTNGPLQWDTTFSGTTQDNSGSGIASVGVSLFDGTNYYNGTAFASSSPVFNAAATSGDSWTDKILTDIFQSDVAYSAGTSATDNKGGSEPSTIASVLLSSTPVTVSTVGPAIGTVAGGTRVTITGSGLGNAITVDFGTAPATVVSDTNTTIVVLSPAVKAAGIVDVTVTTLDGSSATSSVDRFTYAVPPMSNVAALPATTTNTSFTVSWHGSDGSGPGVASYSVYVSDNGGAYQPFVLHSTKTSAVFAGKVGNTYAFYSVATDKLGVVQPTPTSAQATTKVIAPLVTVKQIRDVTNSKHQVTQVLVTFSGPVNAAEADDTATYRLATAGTGGSFSAKNAGIMKLKSAVHTSRANTVALTPTAPFTLIKPVQLEIHGSGSHGLKDSFRRFIDGDHNGTAGGNAVAILSTGGVKMEQAHPAVSGQRKPDVGAIVDALLAYDNLSGLKPSRSRK
jgi:hypothetical protein